MGDVNASALHGRCGNCMRPYSDHIQRREARPICRAGGVYRDATEAELDAGYRAAFPDGPKPIATFKTDDPADMQRARELLGVDAMRRHFGPGGGGMDAFVASLEQDI